MNTNNLNKTITETLELCLSKMSKKLKNDFDPEDKNSIKLLQQFRSTLSTFRTWVKQANAAIQDSLNHAKEKVQKTVKNFTKSKRKDDNLNVLHELPPTKERVELMSLLNPPRGVLSIPAK